MANMDRVPDVERFGEGCEIVGIGVHIVAGPGLARPAVAAPVVRDAAIPSRREEEHLVLERVGRKRPAMTENDRLACSPILVVDLRPIPGFYRWHLMASLS